jgi:hypothetical protein
MSAATAAKVLLSMAALTFTVGLSGTAASASATNTKGSSASFTFTGAIVGKLGTRAGGASCTPAQEERCTQTWGISKELGKSYSGPAR